MPSKKGKGKTNSQPNSAQASPSNTNQARPQGEDLSKVPPANPKPQPTFTQTTNADWLKIETLDDELKIFLNGNTDQDSVTALKLYRIIVHFHPNTPARPNHQKDKLWDKFISDVFPLIKPHLLPPAPAPMQTESSAFDFDPLNRKTTRKQLADSVHAVNPKLSVPSSTPRDRLLVLYKVFIDKDLNLPWLTEYLKVPKAVPRQHVQRLCMEELRMILQDQAPHVFIHLGPMTLGVLVNLYIRFVCEEPVSDDLLVRGFHYSLFREKA